MTTPALQTLPAIGQPWPGQGGTYAGIARGRDGQPDHHLIVASAKSPELTWKQATAWAAKVDADGHADFTLPDRHEAALLFGNVDESFEKRWHWTATQYSDASAWVQHFGNGTQDYDGEGGEFLARAVRRLPVSSSVLSTQVGEAAAVAA